MTGLAYKISPMHRESRLARAAALALADTVTLGDGDFCPTPRNGGLVSESIQKRHPPHRLFPPRLHGFNKLRERIRPRVLWSALAAPLAETASLHSGQRRAQG